MPRSESFTLGLFHVTPDANNIQFANEDSIQIQAKIMEVLVYLAQSYPKLVTRNELIDAVWQGNYPVGEKALTNAIWRLRQILKADGDSHIETVRKSGYRLLLAPNYHQETQVTSQNTKPTLLTSKLIAAAALFLCFSILLFSYLNQDTQRRIDNLTADPGRELYPAISPNGKHLAYLWRKIGETPNLYVKDLSQPGLAAKQITFSDDIEASPTWSKDGDSLFYTSRSWDNSRCQVIRLSLAKAQRQVLANCATKVKAELALSSKGDTLAFTHHTQTHPLPGIYFLDLNDNNAQAKRFSCHQACQYQDRRFAFSPNDDYLAVTRRVEKLVENIFLINLTSKDSQQLTFGEADIKGLVWHPSGDSIVFSAEKSDTRQGYRVFIKDKRISQLAVNGFSYPNTVPNSQDMVYHHWQVKSHLSSLSLANDTPAAPFPLLQSKFSYHSPDYSAKAKQITFVSNESGHHEIWLANQDGGQRQQLTTLKGQVSFPQWSNDGQHIVFLAGKKQTLANEIVVVNVATKHIKRLVTGFDAHFRPQWSYDDKAIIAIASTDNQHHLHRFELSSDISREIIQEDILLAQQDDQQRIWFTSANNQGLWLYQPDKPDDKISQVLSKEDFNNGYNWTVSAKGIYFQADYLNHHTLNLYSFDSQQVSSLVKLPLRTLNKYSALSHIAEQDLLVFSQADFPQVDIKRLSDPKLN